MQFDEFLGLVKNRRSIRRFKPDQVADADIEKILEAARWAMSGANAQPWEFIVVKDRKIIDRIADSWLAPRKEAYVIEQTRTKELQHPQLMGPPSAPGFQTAPVLVIVLGDRRSFQGTVLSANYIPFEGAPDGIYIKNLANPVQIMHLAAAALGLGAQWLSVDHIWEQSLKVILGIPPVLDVHTVVPVGYPDYKPMPPYRRELREIVHWNKYDQSKYRTGEDMINFIYNLRGYTKPAYSQENRR